MTNKVIIYTDGACKGNPGPGGWELSLLKIIQKLNFMEKKKILLTI